MTTVKLSENIYSVGVLNPSMRIFDIVMHTEYGTSYNAYLVQGTHKTALIETVHREYLDYFLANLRLIDPTLTIDYLIMNHNEPDHSGSIVQLRKYFPDMEIYASKAGSMYLKNIINEAGCEVKAVADGDCLDLGGKTLQFVHAPFLHWPDSMFTYVPEDEVLFSCDFLGTHFCEPEMFVHASRYRKEFETAFQGYYDAIFYPFPQYVQNGLAKVKQLDPKIVAPSHGPMLTKAGFLPEAIKRYDQWSTKTPHPQKQIPIFYCSAYGNTEQLAECIKQGIAKQLPDATVTLYNVIEHEMCHLAHLMNESDAFLLGSPTINRDSLPPMMILLAHAEAIAMAKRPVGLFGSYGWSGEACKALRTRLEGLNAKIFDEPYRVQFVPSEEELRQAIAYGENFALWLR